MMLVTVVIFNTDGITNDFTYETTIQHVYTDK